MSDLFVQLTDSMTPLLWIVSLASAILVGMAKNGVPGLGILVVPMLAMVFPARMSVGALLPLLIAGDILAILRFRAHADVSVLRQLLPWAFAGIAAGGLILIILQDVRLEPLLGGLVLLLVGLELARTRGFLVSLPQRKGSAPVLGVLTGTATTLGNAAGPLMNLYLLSRGFVRHRFIGTAAWFFFVVNLCKVPVFAYAGMMSARTLLFDAVLVPFVVLGAFLGRGLLGKISDRTFKRVVLFLSALAAIRLLLPGG